MDKCRVTVTGAQLLMKWIVSEGESLAWLDEMSAKKRIMFYLGIIDNELVALWKVDDSIIYLEWIPIGQPSDKNYKENSSIQTKKSFSFMYSRAAINEHWDKFEFEKDRLIV